MAKGRNKHLIQRRDETLYRRYHYWTEIRRLRFDDALRILSEKEFFISEERIMAIIREQIRLTPEPATQPATKKETSRLPATQYALFPGE